MDLSDGSVRLACPPDLATTFVSGSTDELIGLV